MMEYQKIIIFLENKPNQPAEFSTKIWVEINYDTHGTYKLIFKLNLKI